jgi:pimeloyl-ACP methyl ester carboxylesterase
MPTTQGFYYFLHEGGDSSRPPVILLHGTGGSHLSWPAEIRRISGQRVFTLDLPGHGKSSGVGLQSVADYARRVVEFLDAALIWKAVFVGHSLGGAIALTIALEHPERVAGLGLISCGARLPVSSFILENASNPATYQLACQSLLDGMFGPLPDERLVDQSAKRLAAVRQAVLRGDLMASDAFDVSLFLDTIRTPTLILCGTEDRITPIQYSRTLANGIPSAALHMVEGAGHAVMLEQPRRVANLLNVFLMTVPYAPGT